MNLVLNKNKRTRKPVKLKSFYQVEIKYDENKPVSSSKLINPMQEIIKNIPVGKSYLFEFPYIDHLKDADEFRKFRLRISRNMYLINKDLSLLEKETKTRFMSRVEVLPVRDRVTGLTKNHKGGIRVWRIL